MYYHSTAKAICPSTAVCNSPSAQHEQQQQRVRAAAARPLMMAHPRLFSPPACLQADQPSTTTAPQVRPSVQWACNRRRRKVTSRDEIDCKSEALLVSLHVLYGLYNRVTDGRPLLTLTALWASDCLKISQYIGSLDVITSQKIFS